MIRLLFVLAVAAMVSCSGCGCRKFWKPPRLKFGGHYPGLFAEWTEDDPNENQPLYPSLAVPE